MMRRVILMACGLWLTSCAIQPEAITSEEVQLRVAGDMAHLQHVASPVSGPISLHEAMARSLLYNLDLSLERYKTGLVETELALSRYDQLPEVAVEHLSNGRNNFSGGVSQSLLTGLESLEPSTSSERYVKSNDLNLGWDILDFGVSYFRARQAADSVLLAEEQRRKVVSRILSDVQKAYWRAISYERHIEQVGALMIKVQARLDDSREMQNAGIATPLTALSYQRDLLQASRDLYRLHTELSQAKTELALLMNLPPSVQYQLADSRRAHSEVAFELQHKVSDLEQLALVNRSELMENGYQERINASEIKASYLRLLPRITLDYGDNQNSNTFLFHTNWTDYSARVSWNLLNLFSYGDTKTLGQMRTEIIKAQRLALSAAILTQLHIGLAQLEHSSTEYRIATELLTTQKKIHDQIDLAIQADAGTEQALVREEVNVLLESIRYDVAYAAVQDAQTDLHTALGLNPSTDQLNMTSVAALTQSLENYYSNIHLLESGDE